MARARRRFFKVSKIYSSTFHINKVYTYIYIYTYTYAHLRLLNQNDSECEATLL